MPMRSIPFKQVCLLGMNDGVYPRTLAPMGFDLMAVAGRRGDRSRRDDDRYLFLEALLSAQQGLYISYQGFSAQDNSDKVPSVLLAELIGVSPPPPPQLWFDEKTLQAAEKFIPDGTATLAIGPSANWAGKTWRVENFIALVQRLTAEEGIFPQARVAVFAAPGEEEIAYTLLKSIPAERQIDMIAKAAPVAVAAALQRCQFYIGNDSGLMHCAAAVGTPTLGLFGPSFPVLYHPWGAHCAYVSTPESYEQLTSYQGYHHSTAASLMDSLTVDAVTQAALQLFQRVNSTGKQKVLNHV
jgi:hypothetical protein